MVHVTSLKLLLLTANDNFNWMVLIWRKIIWSALRRRARPLLSALRCRANTLVSALRHRVFLMVLALRCRVQPKLSALKRRTKPLATWTIPVYKTTSSISSKWYANKKRLSFYINTNCNIKKDIHKKANGVNSFTCTIFVTQKNCINSVCNLSKEVLQPEPQKISNQMLSPHPRPHVSPCGCKCVSRSVAVYEQDLSDRLHLRSCWHPQGPCTKDLGHLEYALSLE